MTYRMAAIQLTSGNDVQANLAECEALMATLPQDTDVVLLPETFAFMGHTMVEQLDHAETYGHGLIQTWLAQRAQALNTYVLAGSVALKTHERDRVSASSLLYAPNGVCVARYDKLHLFDVDLPESHQVYRESSVFMPGDDVVVVDTPLGKLGLSICYDIRFPELYRRQQRLGANVFCVTAAFTDETGEAHWHALLRARAIENQCYVVAAAQVGEHVSGRRTYGHSIIIDPWGRVLDECATQKGVVTACIDHQAQHDLRERFPVLCHGRLD